MYSPGIYGVHAPDWREVCAGLDAGRGVRPRGRVEGAALQAQRLDRRVPVARHLQGFKKVQWSAVRVTAATVTGYWIVCRKFKYTASRI